MQFDPTKPVVTLPDEAASHVRRQMDQADNDVIGVRIGVKTAGCSGMQYDVQFATEQKPFEDKVEQKDEGYKQNAEQSENTLFNKMRKE